MSKNIKLSIVSPVYKAENIVEELVKQIKYSVETITSEYEIILIEDGSPDNSWELIEKICLEDHKVKGIKLSRNFGQHYAITAGLNNTQGEWIVVMDCDLQDKPDEIPNLYAKAKEGYAIVFAQRYNRNDSFLKRQSSKYFYKLFSYLTNTKQDPSIANFGIYHKKVINAINSMKDSIRYFPTMSQWVGFSQTKIYVTHGKREEGKSSYSFSKLINLAFNNIIAFSDKPLRLTVRFGFFISIASGLAGLIYFFKYLSGNIKVIGFSSIIISLFFLSGIIILVLGVIGIYLGKVFDKVKNRPTFIIEKFTNQ